MQLGAGDEAYAGLESVLGSVVSPYYSAYALYGGVDDVEVSASDDEEDEEDEEGEEEAKPKLKVKAVRTLVVGKQVRECDVDVLNKVESKQALHKGRYWSAGTQRAPVHPDLSPFFSLLIDRVERGRLDALCTLTHTRKTLHANLPVVLSSPQELTTEREVAAGAFGKVSVASWGERGLVFVKQQRKSPQFVAESACLSLSSMAGLPTPRLLAVHQGETDTITVMQLSRGEPAHKFFAKEERSVATKARCAMMFAFALRCCHQQRVVHNDVALKNFMTDGESCFEIVDFGLSLVGSEQATELPYLHRQVAILQGAPETLERRVASPASDMWQFGWVLHHMFERPKTDGTGMCLYMRENIAPKLGVVRDLLEAVRNAQPGRTYPKKVHKLVRKLLSVDPAARPTAADVVRSLGALIDQADAAEVLASCESAPEAALRLRHTGLAAAVPDAALHYRDKCVSVLDDVAASRIKRVNLNRKQIDDTYWAALCEALAGNSSTVKLNVVHNRVADLAPLGRVLGLNFMLQQLDLSHNAIVDVAPLGPALRENCVLKTLFLRGNAIEDARPLAEALRENEALKTLDLRDNCLSEEEKRGLVEEFGGGMKLEV